MVVSLCKISCTTFYVAGALEPVRYIFYNTERRVKSVLFNIIIGISENSTIKC